jgi:hypothetical protein
MGKQDGTKLYQVILAYVTMALTVGLQARVGPDQPALQTTVSWLGWGSIVLTGWLSASFVFYELARFRRNWREAGIEPLAYLARSLQGLSPNAEHIVNRYAGFSMVGIMGDVNVAWNLRAINGDLIPLDFIHDYLTISAPMAPNLYPIGQIHNSKVMKDHARAREMAERFTDLLVNLGWAKRGSGPYSARLNGNPNRSFENLCKAMGMTQVPRGYE